jgi:hypothetical protein
MDLGKKTLPPLEVKMVCNLVHMMFVWSSIKITHIVLIRQDICPPWTTFVSDLLNIFKSSQKRQAQIICCIVKMIHE